MKSINLLPKIPVSRQYFHLILSGITAVTLIGMSGLTYYYSNTVSEVQRKIEIRDSLQARTSTLMQERMTDSLTASFNALNKETAKLKESARNWQPLFATITGQLPTASRILSMESNTEGLIKVNLEVRNLEELSGYFVLLQSSPLFEKISVKSVQLKGMMPAADNTLPSADSLMPTLTPGASASPSAGNSGPKTVTEEQYIEGLKQKSANQTNNNQADSLLNQLDWLITQQMSKQLHGVEVPNLSPAPTLAPTPGPSSPITQQDIEKARKALESVQKVQVTSAPKATSSPKAATGTTGANSAAQGINPKISSTPAPVIQEPVRLYAAVLEITCKPLSKEK